ncbi:MAG: hypothetical protein ACFFCV_07135 [Promethearchaeota archaeon]
MNTSLDKFISKKNVPTSNIGECQTEFIREVKLTTYCCNYEQIYIPKKKWNGKDKRKIKCQKCGKEILVIPCMKTIETKNKEYLNNISDAIEDQLTELAKYNPFKHIDRTEFIDLSKKYIAELREKHINKKKTIYQTLPLVNKHKEYIAGAIIYITLLIDYDLDSSKISNRYFTRILKGKISESPFAGVVRFFQREIFSINQLDYLNKIKKYAKKYIETLKELYNINIEIEDVIKKVEELVNHLTENSIEYNITNIDEGRQVRVPMKNILKTHGLNIGKLFDTLFYQSFLPQYVALVIVYMTLISELPKTTSKKMSLTKITKLLELSQNKTDRLRDYLKDTIQKHLNVKLERFDYTNETFIIKLNELWNQTKKQDVLFIKNLFEILDFDITTFMKKVISFNFAVKPSYLIRKLLDSSLTTSVYLKIKKNIRRLSKKNEITQHQYTEIEELTNEILKEKVLKGKDLNNGSIKYKFRFSPNSIDKIEDNSKREKILNFVDNIDIDKYPLELFNNPKLRCSSFILKGTPKEQVTSKEIISQLINPLISNGYLEKNGEDKITTKLKRVAEEETNLYNEFYNRNPTHEPIQLQSINNIGEIIGMEIPVWNTNKEITGHIDLLGIKKDFLVIGEYKPTIYKVYKGLPQVCLYAKLISELLGIEIDKIECIIYNKDLSLRFKPEPVLEAILKLVQSLNSKRKVKLKLKDQNKFYLEEELQKLI